MPSNTPLPAAQLLALADAVIDSLANGPIAKSWPGVPWSLSMMPERVKEIEDAAKAYRAARAASPRTLEEERLARIDLYAGETCEAGSPECGPVEYSDVEGVPLCAGCWKALCDEWDDGEEDDARRLAGEGGAA